MSMVVVNFCENFRRNKLTAKHGNVLNHFQEETVSDAVLVLFLLILNEILSVRGESDNSLLTQPAITCSKFTIEIVEQGVKYVQS